MPLLPFRAFVCALWVASLCPARALEQCAELRQRPDLLENGRVFFYTEQGWYPFASFKDVALRASVQTVSFAYVVRTRERDRAGVLVIKSAIHTRPPKRALTATEDKVYLAPRPEARLGCAVAPPFEGSLVSAKGYEDYHERESTETEELRSGSDLADMKRFHVEYPGEAGCRRTDDFFSRGQDFSNASQFSFSEAVIDGGPSTVVSAYLFSKRAYADPPRLLERRTEIRRYRTVGGLNCTVFSLPISGDERNVLRINDLEGRVALPARKRQPEFRADDLR